MSTHAIARRASAATVAVALGALTFGFGAAPAFAGENDATLSGIVFLDKNGNGSADFNEKFDNVSEVVSIEVFKINAEGPATSVTVTPEFADSKYKLTLDATSKYNVVIKDKRSPQLLKNAGGAFEARTKATEGSNEITYYGQLDRQELKKGETTTKDAGFVAIPVAPTKAKITGSAFDDVNRDGQKQATEKALAGVVIGIQKESNNPPAISSAFKDVTGADGKFELDTAAITDATTKYRVVVAAGPVAADGKITIKYQFSPSDKGDDKSDSDVEVDVNSKVDGKYAYAVSDYFKVEAGKVYGPVDAGLYDPAVAVPTASPSATKAPSKSPTKGPGKGGKLPVTGASVGGFLAAGALLVGGGIALTVMARRRRTV